MRTYSQAEESQIILNTSYPIGTLMLSRSTVDMFSVACGTDVIMSDEFTNTIVFVNALCCDIFLSCFPVLLRIEEAFLICSHTLVISRKLYVQLTASTMNSHVIKVTDAMKESVKALKCHMMQ